MTTNNKRKVYVVDLDTKPEIYRTDNPNPDYYEKWCIDLFPESHPSICGFDNPNDCIARLRELFGDEQVIKWFGCIPEYEELREGNKITAYYQKNC
jgi:hypothetical protein